jgi:hypothetical protein
VNVIENIDVTCMAASSAKLKYNLYLKEMKTKSQTEQDEKKERALFDEMEETKKNKKQTKTTHIFA